MTALSQKPLDQSPAGRAFEVWRQTLLEPITGANVPDPDWITKFHDGRVDMPTEQIDDYNFPENFGCAIFPVSWEPEDPNIGSSDFPLSILTALYYKETSGKRRGVGEADTPDVMFYLSAAALSQKNLTWKTTWAAPPAGILAGERFADKRLETGPIDFSDFRRKDGCARVVFLEVAWELKISTC